MHHSFQFINNIHKYHSFVHHSFLNHSFIHYSSFIHCSSFIHNSSFIHYSPFIHNSSFILSSIHSFNWNWYKIIASNCFVYSWHLHHMTWASQKSPGKNRNIFSVIVICTLHSRTLFLVAIQILMSYKEYKDAYKRGKEKSKNKKNYALQCLNFI